MSLRNVPEIKFIPQGFHTFAVNCGIKDKSLDIGVVFSEQICQSTAFFTKNQVQGEPIKIGKEHYKKNKFQAVVVNSKNSNVYTGKTGYQNCLRICEKVSLELNIPLYSVFPSSTGVIGVQLPIENIISSLDNLPAQLKQKPDFTSFAKAIMTTDTFPKYASCQIGNASLVGVTKGSAMIEPNMATTLSYFFTDADISSEMLQEIAKPVLHKTFNSLSIDSDTSTSDTFLVMSNGMAGEVDISEFEKVFEKMAIQLTKWLAIDGEGATKIFMVDIKNAMSDREAKAIGKSIINSPLVKTAIYKGDPNWGRIYMAIGKTLNVQMEPEKIKLFWGNKRIQGQNNHTLNQNNQALQEYLTKNEEIHLVVDLALGSSSWRVYGCDLTEEYVRLNAYYTT